MSYVSRTARYSPLRVDVDPNRPVRVAIIGTGIGAAVHIPVFRQLEDTKIVALGSRRIERARELANRHRIELPSDDYREIVDHPDVDAVVIATPPY
ncbi:MAG TPA: Gfo/Idh/MocA family oxidoreductase, partial [Thermomicrobiales bacterium]|nr:Gfo/Idh/MocA family oxidoreductase [Thermomicrobiales bacterium]